MQINIKVWILRNIESKDIMGIYKTPDKALAALRDYLIDGGGAEVFSWDVTE